LLVIEEKIKKSNWELRNSANCWELHSFRQNGLSKDIMGQPFSQFYCWHKAILIWRHFNR